ncbi:GYD domain-containing protein [Methylocapsa sp. S129]|uniref:GYD domain-containing protein n=1 Tax=Methylocapsa sp. S129 TaxID=1641869 RepID=UPI00131CBF07|nr:GYD domain-containing protein [Methylocapsa sp. S129]
MAIYVAFGTYTDQGIREIDQTVSRTNDFKALAKQFGVTVRDVFWMRGQQYDMVTILEGPDQPAADALLLIMNKKGFIRTQLLRAYTAAEIEMFLATAA